MLFSQRTFQNMSLPVKSARLTPLSRALWKAARCPADQYSSWPAVRIVRWWVSRLDERSASISDARGQKAVGRGCGAAPHGRLRGHAGARVLSRQLTAGTARDLSPVWSPLDSSQRIIGYSA